MNDSSSGRDVRQARSPRANTPVLADRRHDFSARLLGRLWSWGLRLQCATWRIETQGLEHMENLYTQGIRFLAVFWHGKYVPLLVLLRAYRGCIFSSLSPRGDVIAEICSNFDYECVQIADRGGDDSLRLMRHALSSRRVGAIALDGPLGPQHHVHRGAVELASQLGYVVLPVGTASRRKRILEERWDKMEFPRLWTRVSLVVGEPLQVPRGLGPADLPSWTGRIGDAVDAAERQAHAIVQAGRHSNSAERS